MKKGLFLKGIKGVFYAQEKHEKLKKKVGKIMTTNENSRDFLPLFSSMGVRLFDEKEKKDCLLNMTRRYFSMKSKIEDEREAL